MDSFRRSIAVVVGIDSYGAGIPRLGSARRDAERLGTLLRDAHGYDVRFLLDEGATGEQLLRVLTRDLTEDVGEEDRVLFYFAGHGVALDGDGGVNGYLLPADAQRGVETSYLHMPRVHDALIALGCRHLLVVLDCCFAGAFRWSGTRDLMTLPTVIHQERLDRFVRSPAWQVITSAASDQEALDQLPAGPLGSRGEGAHSPFALALFEGLAGAGDVVPAGRGDGVITATELYVYIEDRLQPETMRTGAGQTPRLWPLRKHDKGEFIFLVPGRALDLPPAPPLDYAANPYVGLRSFEASEADLFFGRSEVVRELAEHVRTRPLSVVLGASGTGKSSVVKAGLLPFLASHDADSIVAPVMRPGPDPIAALHSALAAIVPALEARDMAEPPDAAIERGIEGWCRENPGRRLVVVVDQLEELVTLARDASVKKHVVALLERLVTRHADQLRVVVTLRSDFEPALAELAWAARWTDARYVLRPMTQDELRRVIEAPASRRVLYFEPSALVDELINEVVATPGGLPLLSFALSEMYIHFVNRRSSDRAITEEDYHAVGGVIGALRARADREYDALDPTHRATMRRVMLRMVAFGSSGGVRRRVWRSELVFDDEAENVRVAHVLERLSAARLIVMGHDDGGEPWVEPAHDALVGAWNLLIGWVREANADPIADLRFQRALAQSAGDWSGEADAKVREGLLWKDPVRGGILGKLTAAEASGLNRQERSFARRSIRARRRARAVLVATFVIIAALAGAAIIAAVRASASARQARDEANASRAALLGRMAGAVGGERDADSASIRLLLAAEAVRLAAATTDVHRIPDAENVIRSAAAATIPRIRLAGYLDPIPRQINSGSWSRFTADGRWLLTGNLLADWAYVWDLQASRPSEMPGRINALESRSPVPPLIASAGPWIFMMTRADTSVRIEARDTRVTDWTAAPPHVLPVSFSNDGDLIASSDGRWVAGATRDGEAWLIDIADSTVTPRPLPGTRGPVAFSANADWLVTGASAGVLVHDLRRRDAPPRPVAGIDAPVAISNSGTWIVGDAGGTGHLVHTGTGTVADGLDASDEYGPPTFSANGAWLIVRPYHDQYVLWELDSRTGVAAQVESGRAAAMEDAGTYIVTAPEDDRVVVRSAAGEARTVPGAQTPFRVSGALLAARSADGAVRIHDLADPAAEPIVLPTRDGEPLDWGGGGAWLVTRDAADAGDDSTTETPSIRFWTIDREHRTAILAGEDRTIPSMLDEPGVSPDGRWWLAPGTVVSDLVDFEALGREDPGTGLPPVSAHAWAGGQGVLVTGHADGSIRAWNARNAGAPHLFLESGAGEVIWLDATDDGSWLVTQHPAELLLWARDDTAYVVVGNDDVLAIEYDDVAGAPGRALLSDMHRAEYEPGGGQPRFGFDAAGSSLDSRLADGRVAAWPLDSIVRATREHRAARSLVPDTLMPAGRRWLLAPSGDDSIEVRGPRRPDAAARRFAGGSAVLSDDDRWLLTGCSGFTADGRWAYARDGTFWRIDASARAAQGVARQDGGPTGDWGGCILHPLARGTGRPDTLFNSSAMHTPEPGGGLYLPVGMRFSPDGQWVVLRWGYNGIPDCYGTSDLRFMDLHAPDPLTTLLPVELSTRGCPPVEFAPDGRWIAVGAVLRDLAPQADAAQSFRLPAPVLTFDPDGRSVVTVSPAMWQSGLPVEPGDTVTLRFVSLDPASLIDTACRLAGRNPSHEEWRRFFPGEAYRPICPRLPVP